MRTSHRDVESVSGECEIPRRTERDLAAWSTLEILACLLAGTGDAFDRARFQVDAPNQMILSVGNVKTIACERQPLRAIESRFIKRAIGCAGLACADGFYQRAIQLRNNDAIMV